MTTQPAPISSDLTACSITGKVRPHNEDAVMVAEWAPAQPGPYGLSALLAVADGMGGHLAGEWASATALEAFHNSLTIDSTPDLSEALLRAMQEANSALFRQSEGEGTARPGTTLTVAAIRGTTCLIVHAGDSRCYLLRDESLRQITRDDSWAAELVRQGQMSAEDAAQWMYPRRCQNQSLPTCCVKNWVIKA